MTRSVSAIAIQHTQLHSFGAK